MAACRSVGQIASDLGLIAGGPAARIQTAGTPALKLRLGVSQRARRSNHRRNYYTNLRWMESMSVRAVADVATDYGALASKKEMLRRADSYFANDSRPIVLFDVITVHLASDSIFQNFVATVPRDAGHVLNLMQGFELKSLPTAPGLSKLGVCNFCDAGVNFVLDNDPEGRVRLAALQSEAGKALLLRARRSPDDLSSLVLVEKDRSYIKSEGVLRMAQYLGNVLPPLGSLGLLFPLFFRDFVYDNIANNRYSILGRRDQCRVSDAHFGDRFVV